MSLAPLHVHSTHSLLRGVPSVRELVSRARALGYSAVALTDVNSMAGSILFLQECREQGIRPILGLELADARDPTLRRMGRHHRRWSTGRDRPPPDGSQP